MYLEVPFGYPNKAWKVPIFEQFTTVHTELAVKSRDILLNLILS